MNNNAVILRSHWTPPPASLQGAQVPTYINFQPGPFQVFSSQAQLVTQSIGQQVENFFDQFTYKMHQEPSPVNPAQQAYVLELFNV